LSARDAGELLPLDDAPPIEPVAPPLLREPVLGPSLPARLEGVLALPRAHARPRLRDPGEVVDRRRGDLIADAHDRLRLGEVTIAPQHSRLLAEVGQHAFGWAWVRHRSWGRCLACVPAW